MEILKTAIACPGIEKPVRILQISDAHLSYGDEREEEAMQRHTAKRYADWGGERVLKNFEAAAGRILPIGIVVYGIIMLLFLFLFPARESRTLSQMDSIGAGHLRRVWHVLVSAMGILIPGAIIGTIVASSMWQRISDALQAYMQTDITISLDVTRLWSVALLQTVAVAAVAGLMGIFMSVRVNPMNKR